MILGLCENVYRPSTGRSVPQILTFYVLTDPFKRKMHSPEKLSLISAQTYLMLVLAMTLKGNSFSLVFVGDSVEILHLVQLQK